MAAVTLSNAASASRSPMRSNNSFAFSYIYHNISPVIAFTGQNPKFHTESAHNLLKDKAVVSNGQLVGYKEVAGVRTWDSVSSSGDDTEKAPYGVFLYAGDSWDQQDKTKFIVTGGKSYWSILVGGYTINLSRLLSSSSSGAQRDILNKQQKTGQPNGESLDFEYKVDDKILKDIQALLQNTTLKIQNDVPHLVSFIDGQVAGV